MASPSKRLFARGFAVDAETERALRAGLSGREVRIERRRFPAVLRTLAAEPESSFVFVDFDGVTEPETAARQLTSVCAFDTALVALGSTDTARYSRALLQHGMADYLVKPVTAAAVREATAALADEMPERSYAGDVVAFAGSAGSGASTLVTAIARGIAKGGRTASVVDLDPVSGKLSALLDAEPRNGLSEILSTPELGSSDGTEAQVEGERVDEIITSAAPGISLVAYPRTGPLPARPAFPAMSALFRHLANRTHVVLVTGLADPEVQVQVLRQADTRVLLCEPALSSLAAATRLMTRIGTEYPVTLVQCSTRMRQYGLSPAHVRYALADRHPDVVIPFEPTLHAEAVGRPLRPPGKAYLKALQQAMEIVGQGNRA